MTEKFRVSWKFVRMDRDVTYLANQEELSLTLNGTNIVDNGLFDVNTSYPKLFSSSDCNHIERSGRALR